MLSWPRATCSKLQGSGPCFRCSLEIRIVATNRHDAVGRPNPWNRGWVPNGWLWVLPPLRGPIPTLGRMFSARTKPSIERRFVKRGGCGFRGGGVLVQTVRRRLRSPAHPGPGRGRIRARPARRPPSPRPREGGALPLQTPVVRDAWADATCSLNHLFGIAGHAGVAISLVSKGRLHSIARRSAGAAVRVRCGVVLWSSRPPAVARRSALSHTC